MKTKLPTTFHELYDSCLYVSIINAVWSIRNPLVSYAQSWDGINYCFQEGSSRGTISFDQSNGILAGASMETKSNRIGWYPDFTALQLFDEAPEDIKSLAANMTLQYLFETIYDSSTPTKQVGLLGRISKKATAFEPAVMPVATTALWSDGNTVVTSDSIEDFNDHGGRFILEIMLPIDELRHIQATLNEMLPEELELSDLLYELKKDGESSVNKSSIPLLSQAQTVMVNMKPTSGEAEFIKSMSAIGIEVVG